MRFKNYSFFLVVKLELIFVEAYFLFFLYLFVVISSFYNLFSLDHIFVAIVVVLGLWLVAVLRAAAPLCYYLLVVRFSTNKFFALLLFFLTTPTDGQHLASALSLEH